MQLILTLFLLLIADISTVEGSLLCSRTGRPALQEAHPAVTEFMSTKEKFRLSYQTLQSAVPVQNAPEGTRGNVENVSAPTYKVIFENVHHSEAISQWTLGKKPQNITQHTNVFIKSSCSPGALFNN